MLIYELNRHQQWRAIQDEKTWHKLRVMASILISPHVKKGKTLRPEDIVKLSGDIKNPRMTPEQIKEDVNRKMKAYRESSKSDRKNRR